MMSGETLIGGRLREEDRESSVIQIEGDYSSTLPCEDV